MSDSSSPKVLGTGLIALDLVISADPERPIQSWAGGTCGNVLSILAYLGWDAYPIARLNNDPAAARVAADFSRWGVHLDFLHSGPTTATPIIIQENHVTRAGTPRHKFAWSCPRCGNWLPGFRPITRDVLEAVAPAVDEVAVFFLDRLSRAALTLAQQASDRGALVMFEPSGKSDPKLFSEAIQLAHIVKYADQRLSGAGGTMSDITATLLEIQTLGSEGLRFRHKRDGIPSPWNQLDAVQATHLVDTCGSGDWCSAGMLARLASNGREGFLQHTTETVIEALNYGQTLAAWNCGFEGARGGMYLDVETIIDRATLSPIDPIAETHDGVLVSCPACPTVAS